MKTLKIFSLFVAALVLSTTFVSAQKTRPKVKTMPKTKPIIFAVVFDGKTIEPIAYIEKGKLTQATGGDDGKPKLDDFARNYYKPKTKYDLIFGGVTVGKTEIIKSSIGECSGRAR